MMFPILHWIVTVLSPRECRYGVWRQSMSEYVADNIRALFVQTAPELATLLESDEEQFNMLLKKLSQAFDALEPLAKFQVHFIQKLAIELMTQKPSPHLSTIEAIHFDDYFLATCCAEGSTEAIELFRYKFQHDMDRVSRKFKGRRYDGDDLVQILFEKLFVGEDAKIHGYNGRGFLQNWLRVTATRTCIDLIKVGAQHKREALGEDDSLEQAAYQDLSGYDLEAQFLKREYRAKFKDAFVCAMKGLDSSHRTILRQHLVESMSIDQLGKMYGVHRSSAARWLADARQALFLSTRQELMNQLQVSQGEFDSIMALIESNLDVSMMRLLQESEDVRGR